MSIAAKQTLMRDLEKDLGRCLTVDAVTAVMDALARQLGRYEVEITEEGRLDGEFDDFLAAFLDAKQIEGRSEKTLERYRYVISRMMRDINVPIRSITIYHLRSYLMGMRNKGMSDKTVEGTRSVFNSFFLWLQKEGLLRDNPCANINPIKCAKKIRQPFSEVDIERLKEACGSSRDRALIAFLLSTGCRISEVCELDRTQIDFQTLECTVHGKGNKERTVYLDSVAAMLLKRYLSDRKDLYPALFAGKGSERMTPGGVRRMLNLLAKRAGVENVHPHRFRRTLATNLINRGMPIQEVAAVLGHDKIDTTMTYIYIERTNVKNAYRKYA